MTPDSNLTLFDMGGGHVGHQDVINPILTGLFANLKWQKILPPNLATLSQMMLKLGKDILWV